MPAFAVSTNGLIAVTVLAGTAVNAWLLSRFIRHLKNLVESQSHGDGSATSKGDSQRSSMKKLDTTREELAALAESPEAVSNSTPTMAEIVRARQSRNDSVLAKRPEEVLQDLRAGNARFWTGSATRPELSAMERRALILQQAPKVAVLGCADSRVPIEIVFDQGLGDVFAIRVAGNVHSVNVQGSLDYAVHHLGIKLIVVLGHEGCGAVKAAQLPTDAIAAEEAPLRSLLMGMKEDLSKHAAGLVNITDRKARDREAVTFNTQAQVTKILRAPAFRAKVQAGELMVVGAFYEISSGLVDFFDPVDPADLNVCEEIATGLRVESVVRNGTATIGQHAGQANRNHANDHANGDSHAMANGKKGNVMANGSHSDAADEAATSGRTSTSSTGTGAAA